MKLYSSDLDRMGMLSSQAFRAARLVVDSGIHTMRWNRQQAIDYMRAHCAEEADDLASEVDRYIIFPGQATLYMLGMLEILRAREEARAAARAGVRHEGVSRSRARRRRGAVDVSHREDSIMDGQRSNIIGAGGWRY